MFFLEGIEGRDFLLEPSSDLTYSWSSTDTVRRGSSATDEARLFPSTEMLDFSVAGNVYYLGLMPCCIILPPVWVVLLLTKLRCDDILVCDGLLLIPRQASAKRETLCLRSF